MEAPSVLSTRAVLLTVGDCLYRLQLPGSGANAVVERWSGEARLSGGFITSHLRSAP